MFNLRRNRDNLKLFRLLDKSYLGFLFDIFDIRRTGFVFIFIVNFILSILLSD